MVLLIAILLLRLILHKKNLCAMHVVYLLFTLLGAAFAQLRAGAATVDATSPLGMTTLFGVYQPFVQALLLLDSTTVIEEPRIGLSLVLMCTPPS
jgi:hypothetical protein